MIRSRLDEMITRLLAGLLPVRQSDGHRSERPTGGSCRLRSAHADHASVAVAAARPQPQPRLPDRAQHVTWLAGAGRPDFPAVAVLRVATGATMRQACIAAGIDPDAPLVGIPAAAF